MRERWVFSRWLWTTKMMEKARMRVVEPERRERLIKMQCDVCGRDDDDVMEMQEYLSVSGMGGYGSRHIGDMVQWSLDMCQDCQHKILGPYLQRPSGVRSI